MNQMKSYSLLAGISLALLITLTTFLPVQAKQPDVEGIAAFVTYQEYGDQSGPIFVPPDLQLITIGSLDLPPGNYVAMASLLITNDSEKDAFAECFVIIGGRVSHAMAQMPLNGPGVASLSLTVASDLSDSETAELKCASGLDGSLLVREFHLNAIRVDALTFQYN